jgi:two-component system phosphate regulon sensor histidine kinase PhoR
MINVLVVGLVIALGGLIYYNRTLRRELAQQAQFIANLRQQKAQPAQDFPQNTTISHLLSQSAYDALLVLDRDNRILGLNASAETLFHDSQPVGKTLTEISPVPELEMIVRGALTNDGEPFEEQVAINGRNYRVRSQVVQCDTCTYVTMALQDVTQLVRLNRARRDMVANISHELRTPITKIRLIIDGLFLDHDKPKRKESISSLKAIDHEVRSLLWLVQEMADLSMIESGQAIMRMYDVSLAEVVDQSIERVIDQSRAKDVTIQNKVSPTVKVLCDRDLTQRVIVNLVHNAIKWSPEGETITVNAVNGGDEVTVSVLDNGPGVPDDQCERIFERFYQVDASRSGHEGTGLGLAICKHIVEAHEGRIWAEGNSKEKGGRFRFTLLRAEDGG